MSMSRSSGGAKRAYHGLEEFAQERSPGVPGWGRGLALGELGAGAALAVLLALHGAGVAGEEAGALEACAQLGVHLGQRPGEAVADGARLPGHAAAAHVHPEVDLAHLLRDLQRLDDLQPAGLAGEVVLELPAVDEDPAGPGGAPAAGDRLLAAAGGVPTGFIAFLDGHVVSPRLPIKKRAALASGRRGGARAWRTP